MKSFKITPAFDELFISWLVIFIGLLRASVVSLAVPLDIAKISSCLWQQIGRKGERKVDKTLQTWLLPWSSLPAPTT